MAMKNPPRRTTIRGQKHLLAYITPEEAQLLMDNGGSGEPGPMGIPAFVPGFGSEKSDGAARDKEAEADRDRPGPSKDGDGPNYGISGGQATAMFGDATMAGMVTADDVDKILNNSKQADKTGTLPELQKRAKTAQQIQDLFMGNALMKAIGLGSKKTAYDSLADLIGMKGSYVNEAGKLFAPTGGSTMFGPSGLTQGLFGQVTYTGMPNPDYTGPFANLVNPYKDPNADGPDTVPATTNPVTGQQDQCPDGYMFDEDLQACRLAGGLPGGDGQVMTTSGPYEAGDYARMGLLDVAPMGMGLFADRYGAGFGTPSDFSAANLAFRRGAATRPQYFKQAPDLTGYTLLS